MNQCGPIDWWPLQEAPFEIVDSMPYFLKSPNSCAITIEEQSVRAMMPNRILGVSGPSAAYAPPTQPLGIPANNNPSEVPESFRKSRRLNCFAFDFSPRLATIAIPPK